MAATCERFCYAVCMDGIRMEGRHRSVVSPTWEGPTAVVSLN
jgi:hypothetical protein